ncbi:MAG: leucyl/phenylalanyl-tRNA--protein transferase [Alysiella sp.]|uniref:leucyl/phenylalanyl-tRNA--protein transferase n=1 Tax=Alysiella sp. TaxID=1872483 RepID=UPI0026DD1C9E|nr:leucyl/phenylalanyl-tRNA--protein transferase [Alysiella sp.]MDO4433430.1 leucyl/phenylalanyl-tRNA--protein transferase [Alysiella sp.]
MVYWVEKAADFYPPDWEHLDETGCVAVSAGLNADLLQAAYRVGVFPWYQDEQYVYWFTQHPRAVLLPENMRISRSLAKTLRHTDYRVSLNRVFAQVIAHCATVPRVGQSGTWISPDFQAAYTQLYDLGYAHSFECWLPENGEWILAGGFYGVQMGAVFYGESMFALRSNASKIAFACAVPYLAQCGIRLIDCQQDTEHMARFGSQLMDLHDFRAALQVLNVVPLNQEMGVCIVAENMKAA